MPKEKLKPVFDQGMELWIEKATIPFPGLSARRLCVCLTYDDGQVLREPKIKSRIVAQFLDSVRRERLGEDIDRIAIKKFVQMFVDIDKQVPLALLRERSPTLPRVCSRH